MAKKTGTAEGRGKNKGLFKSVGLYVVEGRSLYVCVHSAKLRFCVVNASAFEYRRARARRLYLRRVVLSHTLYSFNVCRLYTCVIEKLPFYASANVNFLKDKGLLSFGIYLELRRRVREAEEYGEDCVVKT